MRESDSRKHARWHRCSPANQFAGLVGLGSGSSVFIHGELHLRAEIEGLRKPYLVNERSRFLSVLDPVEFF